MPRVADHIHIPKSDPEWFVLLVSEVGRLGLELFQDDPARLAAQQREVGRVLAGWADRTEQRCRDLTEWAEEQTEANLDYLVGDEVPF